MMMTTISSLRMSCEGSRGGSRPRRRQGSLAEDGEGWTFLVPAIFYLVFTTLNISHEGSSSLLAHWRKRLGGLLYFGFGTRTIAAAAATSRCSHTERGRGRGLETNRKDTTRPYR